MVDFIGGGLAIDQPESLANQMWTAKSNADAVIIGLLY
jgi:hypothetical protein